MDRFHPQHLSSSFQFTAKTDVVKKLAQDPSTKSIKSVHVSEVGGGVVVLGCAWMESMVLW